MAIEETVVSPEETVDRRDVLREQFDAIEQAPVNDPSRQAAPKTADRPRDETGKFTAAEKAAKAPEGGVTQAAPVTEAVPEEPVWKRPPKSWKKDYHDVWQTADDRLKEYAWQREEQMSAGVQPLLTKAEFADKIQAIVEPYAPLMKGLGVDAPTVIKEFFNADNILRNGQPQEKLAYLVKLAQNYGVDLRGLTGAAQQVAPIDPQAQAILNQLNMRVGEVLTWKEQQEERENQILLSDIQKFAQTHEHFEDVKAAMIMLLQSEQAVNLDDAYKKALRLDDTLFESEVQATQAKAEADRRAAADKAAKSARSAAVSVRGSTPGSNTAPKAQTRREVLAEQFGNIDSRL